MQDEADACKQVGVNVLSLEDIVHVVASAEELAGEPAYAPFLFTEFRFDEFAYVYHGAMRFGYVPVTLAALCGEYCIWMLLAGIYNEKGAGHACHSSCTLWLSHCPV